MLSTDENHSSTDSTAQTIPSLTSSSSSISSLLSPIIIDKPAVVSSSPFISPSTFSSFVDISRSPASLPSASSTLLDISRSPASSPSASLTLLDISRSPADSPSQPSLPAYKINKDNRSFQKQWYAGRPWLEYSIINDRAYCYYCRHFCSTNNLINRNQSDAFMNGFNNWKIALEKKTRFETA